MGDVFRGPKSVLMVVHSVPTATGGAEIQANRLTDELRRRGWAVTKIGISPRSGPPYGAVAENADTVFLRVPRIPGIAGVLLILCFARYLIRHRREYSVIHVHIMKTLAFTAAVLGRRLRKFVILKVSGYDELDQGCLNERLSRRPYHRIMNWGCRQANGIAAISRETRDRLIACGYASEQIISLPNGIDLTRFHPPVDRRAERQSLGVEVQELVVSVGRLVHEKGLYDLLDAWRLVRQKHPEASLCIVGGGPYREGLETVVQADQILRGGVIFAGERKDVERHYSAADMYVSASLTEGLSNTMLEAMAAGLPIVCTRVSGAEDVVEQRGNGIIVPIANREELATAICELLSHKGQLLEMGCRSREIAEELFDVTRIANNYEQLYCHN